MDQRRHQIKRLHFRAWHRGTQEMDLLMGRFADSVLEILTDEQLGRFEVLLEAPDPDLYDWILRQRPVPEAQANDLTEMMLRFHKYE
tara:strand:- start:414 stop:674 length:261 start_codon:yes stop_codon:yes gene_type:complete